MKTEFPEKQFDAFFNERKPSYAFWEAENDEKTELFSAEDLADAYFAGFVEGKGDVAKLKARDAKIREECDVALNAKYISCPNCVKGCLRSFRKIKLLEESK